jgi:hypothetical protein
MKIPKRFKLLGHTINVVIADDLTFNDDLVGRANYRKNLIEIQDRNNSTGIPESIYKEVFVHELMHFLLFYSRSGNDDPPLSKREGLVNRLGELLYQALETMEYDD